MDTPCKIKHVKFHVNGATVPAIDVASFRLWRGQGGRTKTEQKSLSLKSFSHNTQLSRLLDITIKIGRLYSSVIGLKCISGNIHILEITFHVYALARCSISSCCRARPTAKQLAENVGPMRSFDLVRKTCTTCNARD